MGLKDDDFGREEEIVSTVTHTVPGRFGAYGGRYVPETLMARSGGAGARLCRSAG